MLPLLPLLGMLPTAISTIARIVGPRKGNKLKDAADAIAEFAGDVQEGRIPPDQMSELKQAMLQHEAEMARLEVEERKDARDLIRQEGASDDPWIRRARPTFLWLIYLVIFWNFIVLGTIEYWRTGAALAQPPINFPDELYMLFGSAFLGYTGFRSWDKKNGGSDNGGRGLLKSLLK